MKRLDKHDRWIGLAVLLGRSRTCARRGVGCVLVNAHGHILSAGFNGVAAGETHCIDTPCPGANLPSGQGLFVACEAIHAEQNALQQCSDITSIDTCYVTSSPCLFCVRLLLGTTCHRIVYLDEYAHDKEARALWTNRKTPSGAWYTWESYLDRDKFKLGSEESVRRVRYVEWLRSCPI